MPVNKGEQTVVLSLPNGSSTEIYYYGATVVSWRAPAAGVQAPVTERLFVSSKSALDGSKPIRGGIPIAFPIFGPPQREQDKAMSQHGIARSSVWKFDHTVMDNEAGVSVKFVLEPTPEITKVWPHAFKLGYVVTLSVHELSTNLHLENTSSEESFDFQALLHTYFLCDASNVTVTGVKGLTYLDKTNNYAETKQEGDEVSVRTYTDAVYRDAPGLYEVKYGDGGGIKINTHGFKDVVIWNPQADAGRAIGDMEEGGWDKYVCVEPGWAVDFNELPPGGKWNGLQTLSTL
ncbi:hypothetical protein FRC02_008683 [Tulasnella sp. 418]|nr:hypothetical protein FRC02_008683 [Tulasnella sp. 418]